MEGQPRQIFNPVNFQELFSIWTNNPEAILYAGGTAIIRKSKRKVLYLPSDIISLDKIEELHKISRTERFLDIGAMIKLSRVIELGKIVPAILRDCLENIGGQQLKNMATIGGNICYTEGNLDSSAALCALDAQYELRSFQTSRWISSSRFYTSTGTTAINPHELLTRVRIPLVNWDFSSYKKFSGKNGYAAVFMAKTQKNDLSDVRIIYKSDVIKRDRNSESILVGKRLPLSRRIAADFIEHCEFFLSGTENIDDLSKKELINFIEKNVNNLTD